MSVTDLLQPTARDLAVVTPQAVVVDRSFALLLTMAGEAVLGAPRIGPAASDYDEEEDEDYFYDDDDEGEDDLDDDFDDEEDEIDDEDDDEEDDEI